MNIDQIKLFLTAARDGSMAMSEDTIEEATAAFRDMLTERFTKPDNREFTIRMSAVGRPLCQQQMEKAGTEGEPINPWNILKFATGDMIEIVTMALLKSAAINVTAYQQKVQLDLGGTTVSGTLDLIEDDEYVWDVKSSSKWAFQNKYNVDGAFEKMFEDDPFGYMCQLFGYAKATGKKPGGWIVVCKETGEMCIVKVPIAYRSWEKRALAKAAENVEALVQNTPFKPMFEPEDEKWYGKPTGNKKLCVTCQFCPYKHHCFTDLQHVPNPRSKTTTRFWYVGEPK